jgi:hypothetical protein
MSSGALLTDYELGVLNEARAILDQLEGRAMKLAWGAPNKVQVEEVAYSHDYGRVAAAADMAEHMIFHVLNVMTARHVQKVPDNVLFNRKPERV